MVNQYMSPALSLARSYLDSGAIPLPLLLLKFSYTTKLLTSVPERKSFFLFPRISMFQETKRIVEADNCSIQRNSDDFNSGGSEPFGKRGTGLT